MYKYLVSLRKQKNAISMPNKRNIPLNPYAINKHYVKQSLNINSKDSQRTDLQTVN